MQLNRKIAAGLAAGALAAGLMGSVPAVANTHGADKAPAPQAEQVRAVGGTVIARTGVIIRAYPTTTSANLGSYAYGARVQLRCQAATENVQGNRLWFKLANRSGWVAARWVQNDAPLPTCVPTMVKKDEMPEGK
ncbi:SH3 domain-containing protein [Streptomyces sp. XM4193]|uniref:SH3 domain-containing protein n=1 Tax=Streptomyces sp. XM4193 TaxID=2929782 RepID=UPI001FF75F68|nr:SH3 domain-containing protein [Streptomyces sp. XM4193]MCK1797272.1 SH3 domain-containing protein [Streptomyces sp. XM4193]